MCDKMREEKIIKKDKIKEERRDARETECPAHDAGVRNGQ